MLTHVVLFRWRRPLTGQESRDVRSAFDDLCGIDGVLQVQHGADLGLRPGNADYLAVVNLPDWDTFLRYLEHPKHRYLAEVATAEFTEGRWSVQTET